jgi:zinc protease
MLSDIWFGVIPPGEKYQRNIPVEPQQNAGRFLEIKAGVPLDALYKCWHMSSRLDKRYYAADLITEILGNGGSSRLFQSLVKEQQIFSNIQCSHLGSVDAGLLYIEGKLVKNVSRDQAELAIEKELNKMKTQLVTGKELEKVKNKTESLIAFEDISLMNRANSLATYELLGDAELMNKELLNYQAVTAEEILEECRNIFTETNCNTIFYKSDK